MKAGQYEQIVGCHTWRQVMQFCSQIKDITKGEKNYVEQQARREVRAHRNKDDADSKFLENKLEAIKEFANGLEERRGRKNLQKMEYIINKRQGKVPTTPCKKEKKDSGKRIREILFNANGETSRNQVERPPCKKKKTPVGRQEQIVDKSVPFFFHNNSFDQPEQPLESDLNQLLLEKTLNKIILC